MRAIALASTGAVTASAPTRVGEGRGHERVGRPPGDRERVVGAEPTDVAQDDHRLAAGEQREPGDQAVDRFVAEVAAQGRQRLVVPAHATTDAHDRFVVAAGARREPEVEVGPQQLPVARLVGVHVSVQELDDRGRPARRGLPRCERARGERLDLVDVDVDRELEQQRVLRGEVPVRGRARHEGCPRRLRDGRRDPVVHQTLRRLDEGGAVRRFWFTRPVSTGGSRKGG